MILTDTVFEIAQVFFFVVNKKILENSWGICLYAIFLYHDDSFGVNTPLKALLRFGIQ
jgi:hypothetical protein